MPVQSPFFPQFDKLSLRLPLSCALWNSLPFATPQPMVSPKEKKKLVPDNRIKYVGEKNDRDLTGLDACFEGFVSSQWSKRSCS